MKYWKYIAAALLLLLPFSGRAQFYVVGDDPASIRWYSLQTEHYKIVYPSGLDSLARAYGQSLEKFRPVVGNSLRYAPGEYVRGRMPVILHSFNAVSNGSVAWAPKRVDLYTSPEAYSPEPMPWIDNLTIHEQRHVAQMQVGLSPGTFRALGYIFGEMLDGAVAGIYLTSYIEGDAVVAETALSRSGRGRTADFLNYYMIAFDNGDIRSLQRWRLGSQTKYYLNKYAFGYLQLSTMRYIYGNSTFLGDYYRHMALRPYDIGGFGRVLRPQTGGRGERALFRAVADTMRTMWGEEIAARAPYTPYEEMTAHERRYVSHASGTAAGENLYSVRSGITRPAALVRVNPDGTQKTLRAFAATSSKLSFDPQSDRLYWSEYGYNRWELRTNSIIRYYDTSARKTRTLTRRGRLFNPTPSPDGSMLSVTQYLDDGRSALTILSAGRQDDNKRSNLKSDEQKDGSKTDEGRKTGTAEAGTKIASLTAPDSLQIVESAWLNGRIYVSAISPAGIGIYSIGFSDGNAGSADVNPAFANTGKSKHNPRFEKTGRPTTGNADAKTEKPENPTAGRENPETFCFAGNFREEMPPQPAKLDGLRASGGLLHFASDRLGVRDLYTFDPADGRLYKRTSSKYGADDYSFNAAGDTLYYSLKEYDGNNIVSTPVSDLFNTPIPTDSLYKWKVADELSRQEAALAAENAAPPDTVQLSEPKRYRKAGHIFNIHSWAPVYFNVDNIMNMSYDHYYDLASLGVAAISQNQLGTAITQFGYSAHKDPYDRSNWKHSGHAKFTYTGWFPVFEVSVDFNDRNAIDYGFFESTRYTGGAPSSRTLTTYSRIRGAGKPFVTGYLSVYVPFNFTRGGWSTGLIPQLTYSLSNDSLTKIYDSHNDDPTPDQDAYGGISRENPFIMQRLTASVRGYTMRPTADSGVYPRWGIGAQAGVSYRPMMDEYYAPEGFLYVYGYLPGISRTQGLNLTFRLQAKLDNSSWLGDSVITVLPRGFTSNSTLTSYAAMYSKASMRVTADYAIPISTGDVPIGGYLFYFSRLILTPHFDYTAFSWAPVSPFSGSGLWSAGASLTIDFRSFFWIKFPIQLGVSCSYNGGSAYESINSTLASAGSPLSHFYIAPVFSISFN